MSRHSRPLVALTALLAVALLLGHTPTIVGRAAPAQQETRSPGIRQIIVQLRESSDLADQAAAQPAQVADQLSALAGMELSYAYAGGVPGMHLLTLPTAMPVAEAESLAARVAADPQVAYAEPDYILTAALTPTDPRYAPDMWHLKPVVATAAAGPTTNYGANLPPAWDVTTGSAGITVAIIDSGGLLTHEDLSGRTPSGNAGYDMIIDTEVANDGSGRDSNPADPGDWVTSAESASGTLVGCAVTNSSWHGSHVAGTIGASANNGKGITGINWASKLLHMRALGKCGGFNSDIADAIRWAAGLPVSGLPTNPNPVRVINMSLGGGGLCAATLQNAITAATNAGVVVVVAAGNESESLATDPKQPATCSGVITVAATDQDGRVASYSNYGTSVEISAPGGNKGFDPEVMSVLNTGTQGPLADKYGAYQGTSMATPHVAGVVSLMLSVNPNLTNAQVLEILQATVTPFPSYSECLPANNGGAVLCGPGILNAGKAVEEAARRVRTFSLEGAAQTVNEATGTVNIPVRLNIPSSQSISLPYTVSGTATSGADHSLSAGTLTIPVGAAAANISFTVATDAISETAETVIVTLGTPTGSPQPAALSGPATHTVTVLDGTTALPPSLSLSAASAVESSDTVTVTFTVARAGAALATSVSYALGAERASGGEAQLLTGSVSLTAGESSKSVTLPVSRAQLGVATAVRVTLSQPTGDATLGAESTRRVALTAPQRVSLPLLAK